MGIAKDPRKRKVACKEGFKKEDGGENAFLLAISVDKLLAANRHVHKSCPSLKFALCVILMFFDITPSLALTIFKRISNLSSYTQCNTDKTLIQYTTPLHRLYIYGLILNLPM